MAKISNLKAKRDENDRIIKCLIVEDYQNGNVYKHYNPSEFTTIIDNTDAMFLTKVYVPNSEEREFIFKLIQENTKDGQVSISEHDILTIMFTKFTDLELDCNEDEIKEVLSNPSEFLMQIKAEIDKLLINSIEAYIDLQKTLASAPVVTKTMSEMIEKKQELVDEDKVKKEQAKLELLKKKEELQRQLEEIDV